MSIVVFIYEATASGSNDDCGTKVTGTDVQPTKVTFRADVRDNRFVLCTWRQTYEMGDLDVDESEVRFPIDYCASVCDLVVTTPRETIRGIIMEKSKAKATYDEGKKEGKQVFLVNQSVHDNDVLRLSIGNIKAHDVIEVEFTYVSELSINGSSGCFFIPSQITPRYNGTHIPAGSFRCEVDVFFWLGPNGSVKKFGTSTPDMNFELHPDHVHASCRTAHSFDKDIDLKFELDMTQRAFAMCVAGYQLNYVQFLPKISSDQVNKEFVVVLDCSGSMEGGRIRNAKRALMTLLQEMQSSLKSSGVGHSFNLIRYGSHHKCMWPGLRYCDVESMDSAMKFCAGIAADLGGTETYFALEVALQQSWQCILITDGETSDNDRLHRLCQQFNSLCVLGIGNGINRDNIDRMSRSGHGICAFNSEDSDVTENIIQLFKVVSMPVIRDVVETVPCLTAPDDQPTASFMDEKVLTTNPMMFYTKNAIIPNCFYRLYGVTSCKTEKRLEKCTILGSYAKHHENVRISNDFELAYEDDRFYTDHVSKLMVKHILEQNKSMDLTCAVQLAVTFGIITDKTSMVAVSEAKVGSVQESHKPKVVYKPNACEEDILCCNLTDSSNYNYPVYMSRALRDTKPIHRGSNRGMSFPSFNGNFFKRLSKKKKPSCIRKETYMVSLKMPFEELLAYFRPELGVFSANVLTFIGVSHEIYDPVAITLYMLILIRSNYSKEQYQKLAKMVVLGDRQDQLKANLKKKVTEKMIPSIIGIMP